MTIDFACACGQDFSFPADSAGAWVQCPKCRRLNQVVAAPLPHFTEDAPYKLAEPDAKPAISVVDLIDTFTRDRLDAQGAERDLRLTSDDICEAAGSVEPASPPDLLPDPLTGEMIPVLDVVKPRLPTAPPLELPPVAVSRPAPVMPGPLRLAGELFNYRNLIVLLFVFLFQISGHVIAILSMLGYGIPLVIGIVALLLAHFGCVVEETGFEGRDELPGPLRHLDWYDDIWQPFLRTIAALMICYFPVWLVLVWDPSDPVVQVIATGVGIICSLFFPAVLLTWISGSTILNLRPDRVIGLMIVSRSYFRVVLCWGAALVGYVGGTVAFAAALGDMFSHHYMFRSTPLQFAFSAVWLLIGVWAVHYFCWTLGLMYRESFEQFPWVFQFHVPVNRGKGGGQEVAGFRAAFSNRLDLRLALRKFFRQM